MREVEAYRRFKYVYCVYNTYIILRTILDTQILFVFWYEPLSNDLESHQYFLSRILLLYKIQMGKGRLCTSSFPYIRHASTTFAYTQKYLCQC